MSAFSKPTEQQGRFYLWRFNDRLDRYREWNITADEVAYSSIIEICEELILHRFSHRTLTISSPTSKIISVLGSIRRRLYYPQRLRIELLPHEHGISFEVDEPESMILFRAGYVVLTDWQRSLEGVLRNEGDFCMNIGGRRVWFWWYLDGYRRKDFNR